MTFKQAVTAYRNGDLVFAASLYEGLLTKSEGSLDVILNLSILYWEATDPGQRFNADFFAFAAERSPKLRGEARRRFPASSEVQFWDKYIAWADLGEPFTIDEARALLRSAPSRLVPSIRIFDLSNGKEATTEAMELLRQSKAGEIAGARYIASLLEAAMLRLEAVERNA